MADQDDDLTEEDEKAIARRAERHSRRLELLATLEKRIGIPEGFFWSLSGEPNDWAFIVKLSVICEAALTHALVAHVKNDQLFDHFSQLQQGRRLELAKQLGILSDADRLTLGVLAFVRNSFAHRTENLSGSLTTFFESCDQNMKIDLLTKLIQLDADDKPKKDEDLSGHAQFFRMQLFACALRPIQSIANFGLAADKKAAEEKAWTLNEMYGGQGSLGIIATAMRKAGPGAEMYRDKIVR